MGDGADAALSRIAAHASAMPDKPAVIMGGSGGMMTYAELDRRANQAARLFQDTGLSAGDTVALCLENALGFFVVACAADRAGLNLVPISTRLTAREIAFIVQDSGSKCLVTSPHVWPAPDDIPEQVARLILFALGGPIAGFRDWDRETDRQSGAPLASPGGGSVMLYSSGTTGRPKGISQRSDAGGITAATGRMFKRLGVQPDAIYLQPAPLYHAAPLRWSLAMLGLGATVVVMERFDAEAALALIERHRVTVSQWVPTHFARLLKLPDATRARYDVSSLQLAVHAAAPCPAPIKRAMIEWWGPIVLEYFGSSEQSALTLIDSHEWLAHPGSVGRPLRGALHVCDDDGEPLPTGAVGLVFCEGGSDFAYHNDADKTARSRNGLGWTTVGDVGRLDEEGYLYLSDRKDFMIISGGVNIYPQEVEDLLVTHPKVADAAVFGIPDTDLGEKVMAVVQPMDMADATPAFAEALTAWLRLSLSSVKVPKRIAFRAELPRLPTGKMVKRDLRDEYSRDADL
jgi:acyl-CoA synthetase (AMP-forming)/AMP-acid ligase II